MGRRLRNILLIALLSSFSVVLQAQDFVLDSSYVRSVRDSVENYYRKHPWKRPKEADSSVIVKPVYGLAYSPEKEAFAVGGFNMSYPSSRDRTLPPSHLGVVASISTNLSISADLYGDNYAANGRFFASYSVRYNRSPLRFWGLGYQSGSDDANRSTYLENRVEARVDLMGRFVSNRMLAGIFVGYDYCRTGDFSQPLLVESQPVSSDYFTAGVRLDFDTRDAVENPSRGVFLRLEPSANIATAGQTSNFYKLEFVADFYFSLWKGGVLALDLYADLASKDAPWTMWNEPGDGVRMRGYYTGRYRDRNFISLQAELRQKIYKQHGIALWGGVGNVFPSFREFDFNHILPTYGLGYRFTVWNITFRIDAGFGRKGQYGIYAGINQAF